MIWNDLEQHLFLQDGTGQYFLKRMFLSTQGVKQRIKEQDVRKQVQKHQKGLKATLLHSLIKELSTFP